MLDVNASCPSWCDRCERVLAVMEVCYVRWRPFVFCERILACDANASWRSWKFVMCGGVLSCFVNVF